MAKCKYCGDINVKWGLHNGNYRLFAMSEHVLHDCHPSKELVTAMKTKKACIHGIAGDWYCEQCHEADHQENINNSKGTSYDE